MAHRSSRGRAALGVVALTFVALAATACLPSDTPTTTPTTTSTSTPRAGDATVTIGRCPVDGFTYGQGFGPLPGGGFHFGVDMAAPEGTPVYAVRPGTLWYWSTGDVGGYSVYLLADDGNTYYYTHLLPYASTLENTRRPVAQGDVIENVSHSGNAGTFNHLHFEVRLGGPNGTRIDPRPALDAAGCQ
jgi:murein DD-endopeptidase MepM/ murein hydrolase activator NlpD